MTRLLLAMILFNSCGSGNLFSGGGAKDGGKAPEDTVSANHGSTDAAAIDKTDNESPPKTPSAEDICLSKLDGKWDGSISGKFTPVLLFAGSVFELEGSWSMTLAKENGVTTLEHQLSISKLTAMSGILDSTLSQQLVTQILGMVNGKSQVAFSGPECRIVPVGPLGRMIIPTLSDGKFSLNISLMGLELKVALERHVSIAVK